MSKEDYLKFKNSIEETRTLSILKLNEVYTKRHTKYQIGDIIESDFNTIIKIENIKPYCYSISSSNLPEPIYYGILLNKNLTVKKGNKIDRILQSRVISKLK